MIPRRRLPLLWADLREVLKTPFISAREAAASVAAFEREFATAIEVPHAFAVSSGREALCLIIDGLGLGAGDEIVIPAYTLGELLPLLGQRSLRLVPADIDPDSFNVTVASVAAALTPQTRAVLVVHLLGAPCELPALSQLAANRGIALIEDCAHAPGATIAGRPVGSFGVAALFSLEANKALAAFGGGVLTTADPALATKVAAKLALRRRREGPAIGKFLRKWVEEIVVRSPLYALLVRLLFAEGMASRFENFYRRSNDRARRTVAQPLAFSGIQARWARRRLGELQARQNRMEPVWQQLAAGLPAGFSAQQRSRHGQPVFYNFVARYDGGKTLAGLRRAAQRCGLDLGIGSEVMDDSARLLGRDDCPGAATAYAQAVLLPCWDGMDRSGAQVVLERLHKAASDG
jgi:dTDP-4-amino-4,6-dideoxygalactose transaminase